MRGENKRLISDKEERKEQKRYEKIQRMIERNATKELGRAVKRFGAGEKDWL